MSTQAVIAIIDDDESVLAATQSLVRSLGFRAMCFGSADAFIASKPGRDAACIVSDIHMPGLDGLGLLEVLRRDGRKPPIIFMTAYPQSAVVARALAGGAIAVLSKPFDAACLAHHLGHALS